MSTIQSYQSNQPEVICIGEALLDRLGPPGGDPLLDTPVDDCLGGAPANVACGLAQLGAKSAFVGRLGHDVIGENFQKIFRLRGVNVQGVQIDSERPSRIVLVRRDLLGERSFQGFDGDRGHGFADQNFDKNDLIEVWPSLAEKARWLLIGTIPLASQKSKEALLWIVEKALQSGLKIALDINWRPTFWDSTNPPDRGPDRYALAQILPLLEKASLLKLAKEEALWFFNTCNPSEISNALVRKPDVVITDGAKLLKWIIDGYCGEMEALSPASVVDTTGAGDAFTAGLIYQYLQPSFQSLTEPKVVQMVSFAVACGALVCGGSGGIDPQPDYETVTKFLSRF